MDVFDFVHMALLALGGEVQGRTKLQKLVFFLGILTESIDDLGYRAHYYGPYSPDVAESVDRLVALGFCNKSTSGTGAFDDAGFEASRYDYKLNRDGKSLAEAKGKRDGKLFGKIKSAAAKLQNAGNPNYMKLSIAAKTYFMLDDKSASASKQELMNRAKQFGWSIGQDEIDEAVEYLSKLNLVTFVNHAEN